MRTISLIALALLYSIPPVIAEDFKEADIALMTLVRCLVTGGHVTRNEATKLVAQIVKEQSGQFQNVYDSMFTGVPAQVNERVSRMIKKGGGCRKMLFEWTDSPPETPFKRSIQMDWMLRPITYPDERQ